MTQIPFELTAGFSLWLHWTFILCLSEWCQGQGGPSCGHRNSSRKYEDSIYWREWKGCLSPQCRRDMCVIAYNHDVRRTVHSRSDTRIALSLSQGLQRWSEGDWWCYARARLVSNRRYRLSGFDWVFDHYWSNQRCYQVQRVRYSYMHTQ